jgi:hypothetical protein
VQLQVLEHEEQFTPETLSLLPDANESPVRGHHRLLVRTVVAFTLLIGFVVLAALLYASSIHAAPGNSDGATVILEGRALSGGNLTLNHWALSFDSFWLVDAPLYAIAVLVTGVNPQLLHLVPTVVALGVICIGAWIARFGRRGWAAGLSAAAVVVLLGLPTRGLAANFLMGPLHVTTVLWCLLAFVGLRRGRYGWGWLLAVGFLAVAMVGDLQTAALGIVPVCLAGIVASLRKRDWKAGAPAVTAALGSVITAEAVRTIALALGTFSIAGANPLASFHQMVLNLRGLLGYSAAVQGVGLKSFATVPEAPSLEVAHVIGLALVVAAVALAVVAALRASAAGLRAVAARLRAGAADLGRRTVVGEIGVADDAIGTWFQDVLMFAFLGGCATYVSLSLVSSSVYERYLTSVVIFGSILAGRLVGRVGERLRTSRSKAVLVAAAGLVAAGYFATFAGSLTTPPPVPPSTALVGYLEQRGLTRGIGDYWSSSIATVESSDAVIIRPVTTEPGTGYLGRYMRQTTSSWYRVSFEFFVYNTALPWNSVDVQTAAASFGPPIHVASVGTYRVVSWGHDVSVPGDGHYVKYVPPSNGPEVRR